MAQQRLGLLRLRRAQAGINFGHIDRIAGDLRDGAISTQTTYNDGKTPNVTYSYDAPNVANSKGHLTQVANGKSTTQYAEFDELGGERR